MPAPKGNQFWKLRSKHGRDKLFKSPEELWNAACEYFQYITDNPIEVQENKGTKNINVVKYIRPFTLHGLCLYLDCNTQYFNNFEANNKKDKDFSVILTRIRETIYNQKFEGAAIGIFNSNIIARDLGLSDKKDITAKVQDISKKTVMPLSKDN